MSCNWNDPNLHNYLSIHWRASLVPAAAVIPASIVYIRVAAGKKLVVEVLSILTGPPFGWVSDLAEAFAWRALLYFTVWCVAQDFYFEEIKVFHSGSRLEYASME